MAVKVLICLFVLFVTQSFGRVVKIPLSGPWTVRNGNETVEVKGQVPGDIYSYLWKAGVIGDPRFRYNDVQTRWVAYDNWTMELDFEAGDLVTTKEKVILELLGVDTAASVYLNGRLLGSMANAQTEHRFDVTRMLAASGNRLRAIFLSPVLFAKAKWSQSPYLVPPGPWIKSYKGEDHFNFIRKMAYHFGWDWSPALLTSGFWKPVQLAAFSRGRIRGFKSFSARNSDNSWSLRVVVKVETTLKSGNFCLEVKMKELRLSKMGCFGGNAQNNIQDYSISVATSIYGVKLWWPHGFGEQSLYSVNVGLHFGRIYADSTAFSIGFRTVELIQDPLKDEKGATFYFRINGVNMFLRGSNWVPTDHFLATVTKERYRYLLESSVAANIIILRIWGGGLYELNWMYELADQLGIMLWQDMNFACAMYPADAAFLDNVRTEVYQQVWRLQHHPSVVVWSGSNENEFAVSAGWYNAGAMNPLYIRDFLTLYIKTMRPLILREDPSRPFLVSSPTNAAESEREGWVARNTQSPFFGDVHFYAYAGDLWNASSYPVTRCTSEFGFQSLPSLATLRTATDRPSELAPDGAFMAQREHHPLGMAPLLSVPLRYFLRPRPVADPFASYSRWALLSQANQAMIYRAQVELLRRHQCALDSSGRGLSIGAMFWQLNDVWQAPSWASIDWGGRWKMAHYFARRFFAPGLLSPSLDAARGNLTVHLGVAATRGEVVRVAGELRLRCFGFKAFRLLGAVRAPVDKTLSCPMAQIFSQPLAGVLARCGCKERGQCFGVFSFEDIFGNASATSWLLFGRPKEIDFPQDGRPSVEVTRVWKQGRSFSVALRAQTPAIFVWLETDILGWFSDNGFVMWEPELTLTFSPFSSNISTKHFTERLSVISLKDLYQ